MLVEGLLDRHRADGVIGCVERHEETVPRRSRHLAPVPCDQRCDRLVVPPDQEPARHATTRGIEPDDGNRSHAAIMGP
jgi:hypothetical protein